MSDFFDKEYIACSAIWYKELYTKKPHIPNRHKYPVNIDSGLVFCGHRHPHCMYMMISAIGKRSVEVECGEYEQGFLTSRNRFVTREEAAKIAFEVGQIKKELKRLHSEDIY